MALKFTSKAAHNAPKSCARDNPWNTLGREEAVRRVADISKVVIVRYVTKAIRHVRFRVWSLSFRVEWGVATPDEKPPMPPLKEIVFYICKKQCCRIDEGTSQSNTLSCTHTAPGAAPAL